MADKKRQKSRGKLKVRKTGYVIAAFVTAISLGLLVWLTMDLVSSKEPDSSVPLKKSSTTTTEGTSVVTTPAKKEPTTVQTETTEKPAAVKVDPVKLEEKFEIIEGGGLKFSWQPSANAAGYNVYRVNNNVPELIATIEKADECTFTDINAVPGSTYSYMVTAFAKNGDNKFIGENSNIITYDYQEKGFCDFVNLYFLPKGTQIFKNNNGKIQQVYMLTESGYYTGTLDEVFEGYIAIDYMLETAFVRVDKAQFIEGAVALPTSVIGQEGGQICGSSACGPTAASVIVCYDKGDVWDKDDCIRFAEVNKLCDQGSMTGEVGEGGMSAPYVIKFIEMYSNGQYSAENVYSDKEKPSETLKKQIDNGRHSILSVRYAWGVVHHPYSIVHFIEPCAYTVENGKLFFYYGDTSYGNGPKGLVKVSADEIDQSVAMVDSEPKCIIVLKPNSSANTQNDDAQNNAQ